MPCSELISFSVKALWRGLVLACVVAGMPAALCAETAPVSRPETGPMKPTAAAPSATPWVLPAPMSGIPSATAADVQNLKPFGYDFFAGAPASFNVAPEVTVPGSYRLGEHDKIRVRYWTPTIAEVTHELSVNEEGTVAIPGIGDVTAAGLTREQFRQRLGHRLREQLKNPSFTAELVEPRTIAVYVGGAARRPGRYTVKGESNLFNVIYAAGGASEQGTLRKVAIRRNGKLVAEIDVYQFLTKGVLDEVVLQDQDLIFFPVAGARVAVGGQVARPALYEILDGQRVSDALTLAGGFGPIAFQRILRLRRVENGRRVERTVDAAAVLADPKHADNLVLRDGDILTVEHVTHQVRERVSIRGNVSFPGDYSLQRTPTAKALVEEAHCRIGTYMERADLTRLLPDGTPVVIPLPLKDLLDGKAADVPLSDLDEVYIYETDEKKIVPLATIEGAIKHPATYRVADGMRVSDLVFAAGGTLQEASVQVAHLYRRIAPNEFTIIRLDPSKMRQGDASNNPVLQDQDRLVIYRQSDVEYRFDKVQAVGELQHPGEYKAYEGLTLYDLILMAGGPTAQAAGTVEVATPILDEQSKKRTEVKTFPLSEVIGGKHRDEPVKAGMLVSIPRREDKLTQPWKVELRGRFRRPGTYALLHEGEDLASLIERAGGFAEDADPFGVSLTRSRERMLSAATAEQVKTVMETMDQLLPPTKAADGKNGTSVEILDAETGSGSGLFGGGSRSQKVLLVSPRRLSAMPSNSRIGFELEDRNAYVKRLGKIQLCDGDAVEVPRLSDVVQVLGAVQSPGPVLFAAGRAPKQYLSLAGGGAPDADLKRSVVIKGTGGVRPLSEVKTLDPGDVMVVASKHQVIQPPMQRNWRDTLFDILGVALVIRGLN